MRGLAIDEVEVRAQPIDISGTDVQVGVSLHEFVMDLGDPAVQIPPSVRVARGELTASATPGGVRELLGMALRAAGREHGVRIDIAESTFTSAAPTALAARVTLRVGIGRLHATVIAEGRISVDQQLLAVLSGLRLHGKGFLGRLAAFAARRHLRELEGSTFSLAEVSLATAPLQRIEFTTERAVEVRAVFGARQLGTALGPDSRRLDLYVIDAGGNQQARRTLDHHLRMSEAMLAAHRLHVLTRQQSEQLLVSNSSMADKDPILLALDGEARDRGCPSGYGFVLGLGAVPDAPRRERILELMLPILGERDRSLDISAAAREAAAACGAGAAVSIVGA